MAETFKEFVRFFFEIVTLRKIPRADQRALLIQDASDSLAAHSFRAAWIGWFLAEMESICFLQRSQVRLYKLRSFRHVILRTILHTWQNVGGGR